MANIIKANKLYTLGGEESEKYTPPTKQEIIDDIIKIPAVLMRGHRDETIEMDAQADPPILKWKLDYLNNMDEMSLGILKTFANIRYGYSKSK